MRYPGYGDDMPNETKLSCRTVLRPRKDWTCGICHKIRPVSLPCEVWTGTVDGDFRSWRSCLRTPRDECPVREASWPKWTVTFVPDPACSRPHPEYDRPFTVQLRAPDEQAARVRAHDEASPNYKIASTRLLEAGIPDTGKRVGEA
jgi:hypothetical protein